LANQTKNAPVRTIGGGSISGFEILHGKKTLSGKKVMKNKRVLPVPFLILILAGVVSLFSLVEDRSSSAKMVKEDSLQTQTVEQERMAAIYFRILSWLSNVNPKGQEPAKATPQPVSAHQVEKTPQRTARPGRIELCALPVARSLTTAKPRTRNF
jgi:hypothetical protein